MPREEQAAATRAELLRVARELFAARGYADVGRRRSCAPRTSPAARSTTTSPTSATSSARCTRSSPTTAGADRRADGRQRRRVGGAHERHARVPGHLRGPGRDPHLAPRRAGRARVGRVARGRRAALARARDEALQEAMDSGLLRRREVQPLAHMLMGAMVEASMMIANAADPAAARAEVEGAAAGAAGGAAGVARGGARRASRAGCQDARRWRLPLVTNGVRGCASAAVPRVRRGRRRARPARVPRRGAARRRRRRAAAREGSGVERRGAAAAARVFRARATRTARCSC